MKIRSQTQPRPKKFTSKIKKWIAESPMRHSRRLEMINYLALFNDWRRKQQAAPYFEKRLELYDYLSSNIVGDQAIIYLEFGVYKGDSIRYWSKLNTNPKSEFIGFDTFEGLPEEWPIYTGKLGQGHFDTKGQPPKIEDPRVRFFKGLFQDTLPGFLRTFKPMAPLVINNDSDLYSSTLFTLCSLHPFLRSGSLIIFDEFSQVIDEFRALDDYTKSFMRQYETVGASGQYYDRVAIRVTK
jgi:O-methyltransferase